MSICYNGYMATTTTGRVQKVVDEIFFFCHDVHYFGLVSDGNLIQNSFKYLRDMLDTIMDIKIKDMQEYIK